MADVRIFSGILGTPQIVNRKACLVTSKGVSGTIMYGPYEKRSAGRYRVEFELGLADASDALGNPVCVAVDVSTNEGDTRIAEQLLLHSQLGQGLHPVAIEFTLREPRMLEYRVHSTGQVPLIVSDTVRVTEVAEPALPQGPSTAEQRVWENEREFLDGYLRNVSGLIHVGANLGQERRYYWLLGIDVIWVEPIREIYDRLVDNLAPYPRQRAVNALLTDKDGEQVEFQIANNNGASSSILALEDHALIFPDIEYVERRTIESTTLPTLVEREKIPLDLFQALTLDVEGAERLVLEGAGDLLGRFRYVKCEVSDFPSRSGTPTARELDGIMRAAGFQELARRQFSLGPDGQGASWDIVWKKVSGGEPLHEPGVTLPLVMRPNEVEGVEKCE
jgi:FkbM family methyltransferase